MSLRVLLVDDNRFDRTLARRTLAGLPSPPGPVECIEVEDWPDAVPHWQSAGLDLVVLDYHLPQQTGLEILRRFAGAANPPVIMLTGQDDLETAVETMRAGAADYVTKSGEWGRSLGLAIERVLEKVRLQRALAEAHARLAAHAAELEATVTSRTALVRMQAAEIEDLFLKSEEAARLKTEIVANVSHELRTPLNVILGYGELLADEELGVDARMMLAKIRGQSEHLREIIESLLAIVRLKEGKEGVVLSRVDLRTIVAELQAKAAVLKAHHAVTLEWRVPSEAGNVETDAVKLTVIATHLLQNAIKFTVRGRVQLAIEPGADGGVVLQVSDTGVGLPPTARSIIFDDFRQLDGSTTRRHDGLGLGLGIVKRYTDLLGGTVDFESATGKGTTFTVRLPARAPAPAA
jgi:signal transduction histidine kinase